MYQEGELSTAIREPGTLCVPVAGMKVDLRHKLSAKVLAMDLVEFMCSQTLLLVIFLSSESSCSQLWTRK